MYQPNQPLYTIEEYYRLEERSDVKHEYYRGHIYQMAGGTYNHGAVAGNCIRSLGQALLESDCIATGSDVRVKVMANGFEAYPDVSIVCGEPDFVLGRRDVYTNPILIIEVLSPSTAADDLGPKFDLYKELGSLQYYLLIEPDKPFVTCFTRQDDLWWRSTAKGLTGTLELPGLNIVLHLSEVYRKIIFPPDQHLDPTTPPAPEN